MLPAGLLQADPRRSPPITGRRFAPDPPDGARGPVQAEDLPVNLQWRLTGKSAEHAHEGDLVREPQLIVAAPPPGDLASVGLEEAGIADQTGAGDVGVGGRHDSVRNKRPF